MDVHQGILDTFNREIKIIDEKRRRSYRLNTDYYFSSKIKIRLRIEYLTVKNKLASNSEIGRLIYQDLNIKPTERLSVNCRINYFRTDSYNSGVGQYETGLPGVLLMPVLYGKGVKWYLLVGYKIREKLELFAKYSYLIREDVKRIGTGWDELPTNYDNMIGVQIDLKL